MKNLVISILSAILVCNADFWIFDDWIDKVLVIVCATLVILCFLAFVDDQVIAYRRKRQRVERFKRSLREIQEICKREKVNQ